MKLLRRCSALGVAVCLVCRKSALPLGRLLVALPGAGFIAGAIVVCWGCPGHAMRDSSSRVERLRIPRGRKSESAVVIVFVVPVILTSLGWGLSVEIPRSWKDERRLLSQLWSISIQAVFLCRISYNGKREQ
ncbi:hypothetical protein CDL15_Pgr011314 [Punica granatum]|uniref:Uncharacterized protein n=1 Tax=Punica granatum TaxID=22663 RepID=A0A218WEC4_PUNGR|nr:hypothetical protein CDL15_Pgr011314 [Punica granatum]